MVTSGRVFTIERFANGTFRTTYTGPPLGADQVSQLQGNMQLWESPPPNTANDRERFCKK
jgi:hypothetical protein